jgi:DNA polymerase III sliding clamp (beta) subunit (PCNA family)
MKISTKTLVAVAKSTAITMGVRDVRYYLNGAHLIKKGGELVIETTDCHRAAQVRINCADDDSEFDVIVDRESWLAISKIKTTKKDDSEVSLMVTNDGAMLTQANGAMLPLNFVDGKFPDVSRVLRAAPSRAETQTTVGVNAVYASEAFKAAAILANPKFKGTKLIVTTSADVLTIETPTDHGEFDGLSAPAVFAVMPVRIK